jgi:hypothetical protein
MFDGFRRYFSRDPYADLGGMGEITIPSVLNLAEFLKLHGGASFNNGLYRTVHPMESDTWRRRIGKAFPEFEERIVCFGYDWLGRAFALDSGRLVGNQPAVVMFEPGTGEALEIPANIETFHNEELIEFGEAALAISFFQIWSDSGGFRPKITQCVGYKKPLFLGGEDVVANLELSDIDVYWHVMGQLIRGTRGVPKGTAIRVAIE